MRISVFWINFFVLIFSIVIGAVTSITENLYLHDDGKLSNLDEVKSRDISYNNQKKVINNDNNFKSDNADDRISNDFYISNDNISTDLDDKENMKMNGKSSDKLSFEHNTQNIQLQLNNDELPKRSKKKKSFLKKKNKRKRDKQEQQIQDMKMKTFPIRKSTQNPSLNNKSGIVMEMVEAIIDNNYDEESTRYEKEQKNPRITQQTAESDGESNLKMSERREPLEPQMLSTVNDNDVENPLKSYIQDSSDKSSTFSSSTMEKKLKVNRRLKRKRKLLTGDLSCMKSDFIPAPRVAHASIKYIRNENFGIEKSFLEAEYHCHDGYMLIKRPKRKTLMKNKNILCKNRRWLGIRPKCIEIKPKSESIEQQCDIHESEICDQLCSKRENSTDVTCQCHKGFRLNDTRCLDINECETDSDICGKGKCINSVGSYKCLCQKGFRWNGSGKCADVNECFLRGGHGPCQDECVNTEGGYECSCGSLKGTKLAEDGHSCEEVDLCSINNGGCSHTCLDTIGQVFCSCPEGWKLDTDWKNCIDIDECQSQDKMKPEQRCNYDCINTIGSFRCIDSSNFGADQPSNNDDFIDYSVMKNEIENDDKDDKDSYDADGNYDIIEGGSFVSECFNGYYFNETIGDCQAQKNSSRLSLMSSSSSDIACPPLFPPLHGYLECSRPVENLTEMSMGRLKIINRPGSECTLQCPASYRASGTFIKTCGEDGKWYGDDSGICIKYPTPKLICPPNIIAEIPPFNDEVEVEMKRPKTDLSFKRDVQVRPQWFRKEKVSLKVGTVNVTYIAKHPVSKLSTSCTTTIYVVDGEPPTVDFCPPTQKFRVEKHHESVKVTWIEPKFSDNVKVTDISQTNVSGSLFGLGSHQIIYEAQDAVGYKSRCAFKVIVSAPKRRGLRLPIENKNKFYI
ncbi:CLUMA_CG008279, isoform A [Clunio marinus]|uniref:CLUMA_CG008279, isoform A n=1 Tax=Clunio marinus TaxID=568069 RepID=A0A1J1I8P1_9DIPT|nr:CLUMA_CG008279, isoform A [Clunio marinus]